MAAAGLLLKAAAGFTGDGGRGRHMSRAYFCCAAAAVLAGGASLSASLHNLLLLAGVAAAMARGGGAMSALLLAAGCCDWPPGAVLLAVPAALLASHTTGCPSTGRRQPKLSQLAAYCALVAASIAALLQLPRLLPPSVAAALNGWLGLAAWQPAVPEQQLAPGSLEWVGARAAQRPPYQLVAPLLPAASLQPGLGLQWYLLAQAFPRFRPFFLYTLQALPAAAMLPLALRFPASPGLLLAAGALLRCLLHPVPRPAMAALWVGLLPLARRPLEGLPGRLPWFGLGLAAALLLSQSAMQLWLGGGGGNANFLYGMNLLWGGLQAMLLLQLLRSAARQEAGPAAGGGGSAQERPDQQQQQQGAASEGLKED